MAGDDERYQKLAENAVGDLAYSIVSDVCNEIIASGVDQEKVLEAANNVIGKYVESGVKVRKKPAPRAKVPKAPSKDKPIDAITAASRKMKANSLASNILWITHPDDEDYSYTKSVMLSTGYPVMNNTTRKVVSIVNDEATGPLTVKDAKIGMSLGLDIDYDSVQN